MQLTTDSLGTGSKVHLEFSIDSTEMYKNEVPRVLQESMVTVIVSFWDEGKQAYIERETTIPLVTLEKFIKAARQL